MNEIIIRVPVELITDKELWHRKARKDPQDTICLDHKYYLVRSGTSDIVDYGNDCADFKDPYRMCEVLYEKVIKCAFNYFFNDSEEEKTKCKKK